MKSDDVDTPLARLLSVIGSPVAIARTDGEIEFVNDAFCDVYGLDRSAAIGGRYREVVLGVSPDAPDPIDREGLFAGWGEGIELVANVVGEPRKALCLPWHVGGQRRLLFVLSGVLRPPVANDDLLQELRDIERAQKREAVGRLAAGMAHDFNNILTVIMGLQEVALEQIGPEGAGANPVRELGKAAARAAGLTRQLLAMVRQQQVRPQLCYVNEIVRDMGRVFRRLVEEDVELQTHLSTDLPAVWADRGQMEQVLTNLVVNARDAMPDGGILEITTAPVARGDGPFADRDGVSVSVSDTGSGIEDAVLEAIFEPFFTTKEVGRGTGLGLSVVRGIVEQSEGAIEVVSKIGVGTTFTVVLPACLEARASSSEETRPDTAVPSGRETILLVEDEDAIRSLVSRALERAGYHVVSAVDGDDGWAKFDQARAAGRHIDLLVTDVVMPGRGGVALAEAITADDPGTRILFISGYRDRATPPGALVLPKPFGYEALLREVRGVLDGPSPAAPQDRSDPAGRA